MTQPGKEKVPASDGRGPITRALLEKETLFLLLVAAALLVTGFYVFLIYRSYVWSAFFALFLFVGFDRYNRFLVRLFRGRRTIAASTSVFTVFMLILVPGYLLLVSLVHESITIVLQIRELLSGDKLLRIVLQFPVLTDFFTAKPFFWVDVQSFLISYVDQYTTFLDPDTMGNWVGDASVLVLGGVSITMNFALNILFGLILLFSLFQEGSRFYQAVEKVLPVPPEFPRAFVNRMREILFAVLVGNGFVSVLQGAMISLALVICDIPNSILYGVIAAIFSLVPFIGTGVVWLPIALYTGLVNGNYGCAIFLAIYGEGMYLFLENVFKPLFMNKKVGIHPIFLLLAIVGGIKEFGFSGVFFGPLIVTLFMTIGGMYRMWLERQSTATVEGPDLLDLDAEIKPAGESQDVE